MKTKSIKKCVIGCCCTILGCFWTFGSLPTANYPLDESSASSTNGATQLCGGVMLVKNIISPAVVMLTAQTKNHQVEIGWPSSVIGATLLSTTNLTAGDCEAVTNAVNTSNGESSIAIPLGEGSRFFRLKTN